jgi:hypothetical protein
MPQVVVHLLEAVQVEQEQAQGRLIALGPRDFGLDLALEVRVVAETGEMVEIRHQLGLAQRLPLHDHRLDEEVGLVEEVVEGGGAEVDLLAHGSGKLRLVQEQALPMVFDGARLQVQTKETEDTLALPLVGGSVILQGVRRRCELTALLMLQHRYLLENAEVRAVRVGVRRSQKPRN